MRKAMKMKVKARVTKHKRKPRVFDLSATPAFTDIRQDYVINAHELEDKVTKEYMINIHTLEDKITQLEKQLQDAKTERARFLRIIEGMAGVHEL